MQLPIARQALRKSAVVVMSYADTCRLLLYPGTTPLHGLSQLARNGSSYSMVSSLHWTVTSGAKETSCTTHTRRNKGLRRIVLTTFRHRYNPRFCKILKAFRLDWSLTPSHAMVLIGVAKMLLIMRT